MRTTPIFIHAFVGRVFGLWNVNSLFAEALFHKAYSEGGFSCTTMYKVKKLTCCENNRGSKSFTDTTKSQHSNNTTMLYLRS